MWTVAEVERIRKALMFRAEHVKQEARWRRSENKIPEADKLQLEVDADQQLAMKVSAQLDPRNA